MDLGKLAFNNRLLVYFLVGVLLVGGAFSCYKMSKLEDPEVKVKMAMVVTVYPGASAHQVEMEVTDVLEKKIRAMGDIDNVESYSFNEVPSATTRWSNAGTACDARSTMLPRFSPAEPGHLSHARISAPSTECSML